MQKRCSGYTSDGSAGISYAQPPHMLDDEGHLPDGRTNFGPGKSQCRLCYDVYAKDWRAKRDASGVTSTRRVSAARSQTRGSRGTVTIPDLRAVALTGDADELVSEEDMKIGSHQYVPIPKLLDLWSAVTNAAAAGKPAANLMFLGPKGVGKTEGAEFLANTVGLPFVKVDAASMTDPESWFGTREVVNEDGVSVTQYRPSSFALMLEQPCVMLIDEMNRAKDSDRNVLLPVLDKTRRVMNPLTGDVIYRHPRCFIIMSGNRGLAFTGTYAIDPAFLSRSLTVNFEYVEQPIEIKIAMESTGCTEEIAQLFVRFAVDTRNKSKLDPDFEPISTREVLEACELVVHGATPDSAAEAVIIAASSPEGGDSGIQAQLQLLWAGLRAQPTTRKCGFEHPYEVNPNSGLPVRCEVDVPIETPVDEFGHSANPQHKSSELLDQNGQPTTWFEQP